MIHEEILSEKQLLLLRRLTSLPDKSYMAGGTALALQIGHRTSLDFDFFTPLRFESQQVLSSLESVSEELKVERIAKDTLILEIDGVSFSLFYYPYSLIGPLVIFENVKLASIEDIAAMKMVAISTRGKRRDFIDMHYLLQKLSLREIMKLTLKKFPSYQPMVILKGLIYFEDAEKDDVSRKIQIFDEDLSWEKVKKELYEEVEKYQSELVKKNQF